MDYMKIFPEMVSALAKDGGKIMIELNAQKADLWHGATGVAGEAGELLDAALTSENQDIPIDRENLIEELGDIEFYLEMVRTNLGLTNRDFIRNLYGKKEPVYDSIFQRFAALTVNATDLLDLVKKVVVYNKLVDKDAMAYKIGRIENIIFDISQFFDITREQVIEANVTKLATGPNARYKNGYTDQAAQDRADKQAA